MEQEEQDGENNRFEFNTSVINTERALMEKTEHITIDGVVNQTNIN